MVSMISGKKGWLDNMLKYRCSSISRGIAENN